MKTILLSMVLALSMMGTTASAGWVDRQGNLVPDSESMKSSGKLIAQLILSDKAQELFKNWGTPSESVYFPTTDTIEMNKRLTAVIVFAGCEEDAKGQCDLVVKFTVHNPDGTAYSSDLPIMELWSGKPNPPNKSLGLGVEYMQLRIEPGEQLGKYRIDAQVHDKISDTKLQLTSHFTAFKPELSSEEINSWVFNYYQKPTPELVDKALASMAKLGYLSSGSAMAPMAGFFGAIFAKNESKIADWVGDFSKFSSKDTATIGYALWFSNTATGKKLMAELSKHPSYAELGASLLSTPAFNAASYEISNPGDLDMLWGAFLASGETKYIDPIISVLPFFNVRGDTARLMIGGAARWSLTSNAVQHDIVFKHCKARLSGSNEELKAMLEEVVKVATEEREESL